jgi:hypothetical protein
MVADSFISSIAFALDESKISGMLPLIGTFCFSAGLLLMIFRLFAFFFLLLLPLVALFLACLVAFGPAIRQLWI